MIVVAGLRKSLRTGSSMVDILKGIDFTIAQGEFVAIMGASGSGKSTLLGLLAGLDNPTSGTVSLNGTVISNLAEDKLAQLRGKTIGFVFQSYQLIPTLTALENVLLPYELNGSPKAAGADAGERGAGLDRARKLLESVGLTSRMDHYPPIVLADEPTGNLDTANGSHILDLLLHLNHVEGTTLVLVTHDPVLATYAGRRIVLRDGLVVEDTLQTPASAPAHTVEGA
jgi:putative ABC transport system ATP-binding protein